MNKLLFLIIMSILITLCYTDNPENGGQPPEKEEETANKEGQTPEKEKKEDEKEGKKEEKEKTEDETKTGKTESEKGKTTNSQTTGNNNTSKSSSKGNGVHHIKLALDILSLLLFLF